ncbi:FKBP-type peptidyl-prolyl cis-trans isomerase [Poritiphilus flavus]|uniref:Peptidyl-prolyl cis-trans isomerase n=1 Tax=Poritiphilus flavus TaxID=2697053 RepID=A0A6L9EHJ1_9FLAO|nr:FKBP-type peptidyl-prolyl cis-trans isomerase [Poritiphilus flavus]NAS14165.1 FKBP-type peptidyl-prolyl cis-trans isomerase [Poritiphilus flavus]
MKLLWSKTALFIFVIFALSACKDPGSKEVTLTSGLRYEVLKEGSGKAAQIGDEVIIKEKLEYMDGTLLYSTENRGVNLPKFTLGQKHVIDGVDQGVQGMRVGEVRKLVVPPELSKRETYPKFLSADSTLVYTIELITIM